MTINEINKGDLVEVKMTYYVGIDGDNLKTNIIWKKARVIFTTKDTIAVVFLEETRLLPTLYQMKELGKTIKLCKEIEEE